MTQVWRLIQTSISRYNGRRIMQLKRSRSLVEIPMAKVDQSRLRLDNIQKDFRIHIDMENY